MSQLRFHLLGSPQVWHDQQLLTFATRKELALLLYLAVEGGMHPRHKLTLLLWPDSESGRGRAALRSSLYHLHMRIDTTTGSEHRPHLKSEHTSLGLNETGDLSLDVQTLQEAWNLARMLPQELSTLGPTAAVRGGRTPGAGMGRAPSAGLRARCPAPGG